MKQQLEQLLLAAVGRLVGNLLPELPPDTAIGIERTKDAQHGDFATNIALRLAKNARRNPSELAQQIIAALPPNPYIAEAAVAGAGFINFFLTPQALRNELVSIHELGDCYGRSSLGQGSRVLVKFVSASPTGPLHVGQGRQAAYAATLASILSATGFDVKREYCIDDADRQTDMAFQLNATLAAIRQDLDRFGVTFDWWFSAKALADTGIVYSRQSAGRGFEIVIDVVDADHPGYVARVRAEAQALGEPDDRRETTFIQFVNLFQGKGRVPLGKRETQLVTLDQLREEVGTDACRFFYLLRSHDQPLDFDLELAKVGTQDNPVYCVQYAHARIASVLKQAAARAMPFDRAEGLANATALTSRHDRSVLQAVTRYPEIVEQASTLRAPHMVAHYLRDLANVFHTYYNAAPLLVPESRARNARLAVMVGVQQVIRNGLTLLGVTAPESM